MLKKLGHILTYHDSEPTEIIQGLIWLIFAPVVLMMERPELWYVNILSVLVGFGTLWSVVYSTLAIRKYFGFAYGFMAILFSYIFLAGLSSNAMNWGWVVIAISALSNIRRIQQKIKAQNKKDNKADMSKMYREELEKRIQDQESQIFELRLKLLKSKRQDD